ncbi:MAG: RAD52 family DNA repair protein [Pseudomonadales bacterium]|nr:RAD52 family DNA repair protein [Pseudomonadales bacterium]
MSDYDFTEDVIYNLNQPLEQKHIKQREGSFGKQLSYIETHHAIREANRIFGFDGWSCVTKKLEAIHPPYEYQDRKGNKKFVTAYLATVEVRAGGVSREGSGYGNGIASSPQDTYELALKEAESDALKRALKNFGDPFGLALYDKEQAHVTSQNVMSYDEVQDLQDQWLSQAKQELSDMASLEEAEAWWDKYERPRKRMAKNRPDLYKKLEDCYEEINKQLKEHS